MNFLKKIFGSKDLPIQSNSDFWNWFNANSTHFFKVVQKQKKIEKDFFDPLSKKLGALREGYFYLTGMFDDQTAELILTADGALNNIPFVEALVEDAPHIPGWRITALKPAHGIENAHINMYGFEFGPKTLMFYSNTSENYPDEIDITIVHQSYNESNASEITNGVYIFLDVYLGELNSISVIDSVSIAGGGNDKELTPIGKLEDYLNWRQKEFVEKYEAIKYNTEEDAYLGLEAKMNNGMPMFASINSTLLAWDYKASHPWAVHVIITFDGGENGLPDNDQAQILNTIEDDIGKELVDFEGYLNVGRQVSEGERIIFYACKDFRLPAKVVERISKKYNNQVEMSFDIFKDKYWRYLERFQQ